MQEHVPGARATAVIEHRRKGKLLWRGKAKNLVTNVGRDHIHRQAYATNPTNNGMNYVALSNDTVTEDATSTTLSNEITGNGLARAQGTIAHTAGTNISTIEKTFTATGAQSCQKAALFRQASGGEMNHVLGFTQRNLLPTDTIKITFTITLG